MNHNVTDLSLAGDSGQSLLQRHKDATKQTMTKKPKLKKILNIYYSWCVSACLGDLSPCLISGKSHPSTVQLSWQ